MRQQMNKYKIDTNKHKVVSGKHSLCYTGGQEYAMMMMSIDLKRPQICNKMTSKRQIGANTSHNMQLNFHPKASPNPPALY